MRTTFLGLPLPTSYHTSNEYVYYEAYDQDLAPAAPARHAGPASVGVLSTRFANRPGSQERQNRIYDLPWPPLRPIARRTGDRRTGGSVGRKPPPIPIPGRPPRTLVFPTPPPPNPPRFPPPTH